MTTDNPLLRRGPSGPFEPPIVPPADEGLTTVLFVNRETALPLADQDGSAVSPFATIMQAVAVLMATALQSGVVMISPADYSAEAVSFAPTVADSEITLAGWTPVSLVQGGSYAGGGALLGDIEVDGAMRLHLTTLQANNVLSLNGLLRLQLSQAVLAGQLTAGSVALDCQAASVGEVICTDELEVSASWSALGPLSGDNGVTIQAANSAIGDVTASAGVLELTATSCTVGALEAASVGTLSALDSDVGTVDIDAGCTLLSVVESTLQAATFGGVVATWVGCASTFATITAEGVTDASLSQCATSTLDVDTLTGLSADQTTIDSITAESITNLNMTQGVCGDITTTGAITALRVSDGDVGAITSGGTISALTMRFVTAGAIAITGDLTDGSFVQVNSLRLTASGAISVATAWQCPIHTFTGASLGFVRLLNCTTTQASINFAFGGTGTLDISGGSYTVPTFNSATVNFSNAVRFSGTVTFGSGVTIRAGDASSEKQAQLQAIVYDVANLTWAVLDQRSPASRINNAAGTHVPASFSRYTVSASGFTNNRSWTIDATSSVVGQRLIVERYDTTAFTLAIGGLYTFPADGVRRRATFTCTVAGTTFVLSTVELL